MSEFQSHNYNLEDLSRRERMRVLGVQAVIAGMMEPKPVTPPEIVAQHGFNLNGDYV